LKSQVLEMRRKVRGEDRMLQSGYASLVSQPVAHLVLKKTLTLTQQGW